MSMKAKTETIKTINREIKTLLIMNFAIAIYGFGECSGTPQIRNDYNQSTKYAKWKVPRVAISFP